MRRSAAPSVLQTKKLHFQPPFATKPAPNGKTVPACLALFPRRLGPGNEAAAMPFNEPTVAIYITPAVTLVYTGSRYAALHCYADEIQFDSCCI